jgi:hypothetical protein
MEYNMNIQIMQLLSNSVFLYHSTLKIIPYLVLLCILNF